MLNPHRPHDNNRSSLFEKLPPNLLRVIDAAIIERVPPTFHAAWMQFELAKHGVSYTAFYRYARRLRDRANLSELAALSSEDETTLEEPIRKLVSRRLVELLLNTEDEVSVKEIAALMSAHRQAARTALNDRRLTEQARLAEKRLSYVRKRLRLAAQSLRIARRRILNPSNPPHHRSLPHLGAPASNRPNDKSAPHSPDRDHEQHRPANSVETRKPE